MLVTNTTSKFVNPSFYTLKPTERYVQVNIHTDTLNESGFVESKLYSQSLATVISNGFQAQLLRLAIAQSIHTTVKAPVSNLVRD